MQWPDAIRYLHAGLRETYDCSDEPFQYTSRLYRRNIRLIRIHSGEEDEIIRCSLVHQSLETSPLYNALSYVCGDASDKVPILCNGRLLKVTRDLHAALAQLRELEYFDLIWIDAICINQLDVEEKTEQVRLMRNIYGDAALVIVWLGAEEATDEKALLLLRRLYELHYERRGGPYYELLEDLNLPDTDDPAWPALQAFFQRPWFSRVWIIQELALARESVFLCGGTEIPSFVLLSFDLIRSKFTEVMSVFDALTRSNDLSHNHLNGSRLALIKSIIDREKMMPIMELMDLTTEFDATDPRDKVYALVGLTHIPSGFIDYSQSSQIVFTKTAEFCLRSSGVDPGGPLDFLSLVRPEGRSSDVPSWVSSWTTTMRWSRPLLWSFPSSELWEKPRTEFSITTASKSLFVKGRIIDRVKVIVDVAKPVPSNDPDSVELSVQGMMRWHTASMELARSSQLYPKRSDADDSYWRTLICGHQSSRERARSEFKDNFETWHKLLANFAAVSESSRKHTRAFEKYRDVSLIVAYGALALFLVLRACRSRRTVPAILHALPRISLLSLATYSLRRPIRNLAARFTDRIMHLTTEAQITKEAMGRSLPFENAMSSSMGRDFCITERGYLGMVAAPMRVGDRICIFEGCRMPFVLRPAKGDRGYVLLGDCYVHGLMDGEAIELPGLDSGDIKIV